MNDIICPNCKKAFKVDKAGFAEILKQVRDHQFEEELNSRLNLAEKEKDDAVKLALSELKNSVQRDMAEKDAEIAEMIAKQDNEIIKMQSEINSSEAERKLAVSEATKKIERERDSLISELKNKDTEKELLQKSLNEIAKERTTIVIAHRLSTIRNADTTIVIDKNNISEMGDHDELISENGIYKKLWDIQTGKLI